MIFAIVSVSSGVIAYTFAASALKEQLVMKCQALAATVATILAEDSDGYEVFLETLDMETDYYIRTKELMMRLKQVNEDHVTYIYTVTRLDEDTIVYILGGEPPSSPVYTAPGVTDVITDAERIAFDNQTDSLGENFVETEYGLRLSAYVPIIHKETGAFLGLAAADIVQTQYNEVMTIFVVQTAVSITVSLMVFILLLWWLFASVRRAIKSEAQVLSLHKRLAQEGYDQIKAHLQEVGWIKHEIRNHLAALRTYMKDGRYADAENYLEKFAAEAGAVTDAVYHDHFLINAVLGSLLNSAKEFGIQVDLNLKAAPEYIADHDFYSLLTNILENAVEACTVIPEGSERFIRLSITHRAPYLIIRCENSRAGQIISTDGQIQSSKAESGHGFGLWTLRRIVDTYDGIMDISYGDFTFTITAALKDA
jgi:signal transduction histidine kinase